MDSLRREQGRCYTGAGHAPLPQNYAETNWTKKSYFLLPHPIKKARALEASVPTLLKILAMPLGEKKGGGGK